MTLPRDRNAWLQGGESRCNQPPPIVHRTWRLIILGPPGVGKGTQARLLTQALGACPLSTGDVFRTACHCTPAHGSSMALAKACMERGELVPDELVLNLIRDRKICLHCRGGFILDGFPRTLPQARSLDAFLAQELIRPDAVICYDLPDEVLLSRLTGRRVCSGCKRGFHVTENPPRTSATCDDCGAPLTQRADDTPEVVRVRLSAYHATHSPLAAHYQLGDLLHIIPAHGRPEEIFARTLDALAPLALAKPLWNQTSAAV